MLAFWEVAVLDGLFRVFMLLLDEGFVQVGVQVAAAPKKQDKLATTVSRKRSVSQCLRPALG